MAMLSIYCLNKISVNFSVSLQPKSDPRRLVLRFLYHTQLVTIRRDSPERAISSSRRPLPTQHKRRTSMSSAGLELAIPGSERPQTHAVDRAVTGIGYNFSTYYTISFRFLIMVQHTTYSPSFHRKKRQHPTYGRSSFGAQDTDCIRYTY
jgi:hypothetical protein